MSEYPSLGGLARANAQLRVQSRRVETVVEAQLDGVERLFRAATAGDWNALARVSDELSSQPPDAQNKAVVRSACKVCDLLRRDPTGRRASRKLAELLHACHMTKARRRAASQQIDPA